MNMSGFSDQNSPLELVNVVGSGDIEREVDIIEISKEADIHEAYYEGGRGSVLLRFREGGGLVIFYRTGKYIVRGGKSFDTLNETHDNFLGFLAEKKIIDEGTDTGFEVNNLVFVGDLGKSLDLQALMLKLGLENAELEPEQFPGMVYRPPDFGCTLLIFGSGKVSITGSKTESEALDAFHYLQKQVEQITG